MEYKEMAKVMTDEEVKTCMAILIEDSVILDIERNTIQNYIRVKYRLIGLYNSLSSAKMRNKDLQKKIEAYQYDIDDYKDINKDLKKQLAEKEDYESKYNELNSQLDNYKDQQATINDQNNKLTEIQSQYDSLQSERDNLQQQVDAKKAAEEQAARAAQQQQWEQESQSNEETVYWVAGGECYHSSPNCATLKRSSNIVSGSVSSAGGRRPCKVCH